jgi:hypothetical protein
VIKDECARASAAKPGTELVRMAQILFSAVPEFRGTRRSVRPVTGYSGNSVVRARNDYPGKFPEGAVST